MSFKEFASSIFWWEFNRRALDITSKSARRGFAIPMMGWAEKYGLQTTGFGTLATGEIGTTKARLKALRMFEREGVFGYRAVEQEVARKFGQKTAATVGKRYLLGRAAGIGLAAADVYLWGSLAVLGVGLAYGAVANEVGRHTYTSMGDYFPETQAAVTSRQRALRAITASHLQARSAIGNEAMLMHR